MAGAADALRYYTEALDSAEAFLVARGYPVASIGHPDNGTLRGLATVALVLAGTEADAAEVIVDGLRKRYAP